MAANQYFPQMVGGKTLERMLADALKVQRVFNSLTDYTNVTNNAKAEAYNGPILGGLNAVSLPASSAQDPTKSSFQILFDQKKGVPFLINDIDQAMSNIGLQETLSIGAKEALFDAYDTYHITQMIAGTKDANRKDLNSANDILGEADIKAAREHLNTKGAPLTGRYMLVSPQHESDLYDITNFISADKIGSTTAIKDGVIGRIYGFNVIMSNLVPKVKPSTGKISATANENTVYPVLFYSDMFYGWARQKDLGYKMSPDALQPGDVVNLYTVFGGTVQFEEFCYLAYAYTAAQG